MTDDERKDIISRARQHVYDLADGKARWTMEIPPRAMTDSDFLLLAPGHIAEALMVERDRLRDILDCETGKRAPEGWTWFDTDWCWFRRGALGWVEKRQNQWIIIKTRERFDYALEAIEAADRAAKENA